jgi:hypothetical protein
VSTRSGWCATSCFLKRLVALHGEDMLACRCGVSMRRIALPPSRYSTIFHILQRDEETGCASCDTHAAGRTS